MSTSNLVRVGGLAAVAAGVLLVIAELMYLIVGFEPSAESFTSASGFIQNALFLLGGVLSAGGLISLYAGRSGGALGSVAFLVAFVGTVLVAGAYWDMTFTVPALAREVPELVEAGPPGLVMFGNVLSFGLFSLGWLLFWVAVLRTRSYPRGAAVLLMVGSVLAFFPFPFTVIPFGLAVAWMGLSLLSERGAPAEQPARVQ